MSLKEKIQKNMISALKEKRALESSVLKMLRAAITNEEIKQGKKDSGLRDEETIKIIRSEAKKRNDAIEAYDKGGRDELAKKEREELEMLKAYLPEELSDEEIEKAVKEAKAETGAESMKEFGNVMKVAMVKLKGQADGKKVSEIAQKLLNG